MKYCDLSETVVRWGSEEVVIPYISPIDRKPHRYYVDFIVDMKTTAGGVKTMLIEVKPKKQCCEPKKPKRNSRSSNMLLAARLVRSSISRIELVVMGHPVFET